MKLKRIGATAASATLLAVALVGCSEAEKAADEAGNKAKEAASGAADKAGDAAKKAGEDAKKKAGDAADKAKKKAKEKAGAGDKKSADKAGDKAGGKSADNAGGKKNAGNKGGAAGDAKATIEYGKFANDKSAKAAGAFYTARTEAVNNDGDTAKLADVSGGDALKAAEAFVKKNAGKSANITVKVVGVKGSDVQICAGPKAENPRMVTVEGGKVTANTKGDQTC